MTLEQLEVVLAIVETGSFRAAAEKLNRSQPALSVSVKNLEEEFDLQIFDRTHYRPKLTEAGNAFVAVARSTLAAAQYTARVAQELGAKKAETKIRISADPLISEQTIQVLAFECAKPALPVTLILEKSIFDSGTEKLISGVIDLAIAPSLRDDNRIESILLESVVMVGAISKKLLNDKRRVSQEVLYQFPQVFAYDLDQSEDPSHIANVKKDRPGQCIFVPDHATKVKLIEAGIGWGRVSTKELKASDDLTMIDKSTLSHISLDLCLLRAKNKPLGPTARAIWSVFEKKSIKR